ncbi:hypothetical protein BpHYR1_048959 [Brachionus plicatilis]|uniref:HAT C-terminal dimerisation domain-containing protein n=1 Tax=Brachionus plicatilis TaxID=10195 RepID=A0A3M7R2N6_BRAPC|nr:hypothetical protein BpHYR1_048959 [Brachionus plicatilis]
MVEEINASRYLKNFNFLDLNSPIYLAAAVLNVGAVEAWSTRSYCKPWVKMKKVFSQKERANFQADSQINSQTNHQNNIRLIVKPIIKIIIYLIKTLVNDMLMVLASVDDNDSDDAELLNKKYNTEIDRLKILLREVKINSKRGFWNKYGKELPNLYSLTLRLSSIPSTSAFVERFFSLTGIINRGKTNLSEELLVNRAISFFWHLEVDDQFKISFQFKKLSLISKDKLFEFPNNMNFLPFQSGLRLDLKLVTFKQLWIKH